MVLSSATTGRRDDSASVTSGSTRRTWSQSGCDSEPTAAEAEAVQFRTRNRLGPTAADIRSNDDPAIRADMLDCQSRVSGLVGTLLLCNALVCLCDGMDVDGTVGQY